MTLDDYQKRAVACWEHRGESMLHDALALAEEAGECCRPIRRAEFYGHPLDVANLAEEIGQTLWNLARLAHKAGLSLDGSLRGLRDHRA